MLLLWGQGKLHDDDASKGGIWREKEIWTIGIIGARLNSEQGVPYYSPRLNEQAGYTPKVVC